MDFLSKYIFTLTTSSILGMTTLFASEINSEETDSSTQLCSNLTADEATAIAIAQNSNELMDKKVKDYISGVFAKLFNRGKFNNLYGSEFVDIFIQSLDPNEAIAQKKWDMLANIEISFDNLEKFNVLEKLKEEIASFRGVKEYRHTDLEGKIIKLCDYVFKKRQEGVVGLSSEMVFNHLYGRR